MAGHRECVISLEPGEVKVTKESKESFYSTSKGYAEMSNNRLLLLVEALEPSAEIDVNRAQSALDRARKRMKSKNENLDILRAENALTRQGTGIGLNIVKGHIKSFKGTITFKSAKNKGTTFIVKLPLIKEK